MNSKSKAHPNGLGNSSNLIGKYLHDTTGAGRGVFIPELMNRKTGKTIEVNVNEANNIVKNKF